MTISLALQLVAWVVTPVLPLFKVPRKGWLDNGKFWNVGPRLPLCLAWFDTPDNSLLAQLAFRP